MINISKVFLCLSFISMSNNSFSQDLIDLSSYGNYEPRMFAKKGMSKSELEQKIDWVANEKWFVDLMRNKPRVVNGKLSAEAKLVNKMELMQAIQASLYPDFLKSFRNDDLPMSLIIA